MKKKNQDIRTGLFALIIVIVIIFIIGLIVNKPEPLIIEGEAVASEVRISGKVPGRIHEFRAEEGAFVKAGDTLVVIESPELSAKLEQDGKMDGSAMPDMNVILGKFMESVPNGKDMIKDFQQNPDKLLSTLLTDGPLKDLMKEPTKRKELTAEQLKEMEDALNNL